MSPRLRNLLLTSTALLALGSISRARPGRTAAIVVGGSATVTRRRHLLGHRQPDEPPRHRQLAHVQRLDRRRATLQSAELVRRSPSTASPAGMGPSIIDGILTANGRVFIINRDGMLFGRNAGSTPRASCRDHKRHRNEFRLHGRPDELQHPRPPRRLDRQSRQHHRIEPRLRGAGGARRAQFRHHHRDLGTVALASGNTFTLDMYGDKLIQVAVATRSPAR